jgi:glutathione peroxidase
MTLYDFTWKRLTGEDFPVDTLKGKKVLVVNVASECGLTPQYVQLQELYSEFGGDSFEIVAFPCNDFGAQEPGSPEQIAQFCEVNYGVTFPVMEKIQVKGENAHPLYRWMLQETGSEEVKWNFHKFLINENGLVVRELAPTTSPLDEELVNWITA